MKDVAIIIPAYKPERKLTDLVAELKESGFTHIIVVDDGGGEEYSSIFAAVAELGADVLTHAVNMGKGRALKTAFNRYLTTCPDTVGAVTMDADGQHSVADVIRMGEALKSHPHDLVLGVRSFASMPARSRFGNTCTRIVYRLVSGRRVSDTQTGLRAFPRECLPGFLRLSGERYEYEMAMLMELKHLNMGVTEIPIETIYENNNEGSHFNTFSDSWLVYKVILGFIGSSVISFMVDYLLFAFLFSVLTIPDTVRTLVADICARAGSSLINFTLNRKVLLTPESQHDRLTVYLAKYYMLVLLALAADFGLIRLLAFGGVPEYLGKLISGVILYIVNFWVQKRFIFK